MPKEGFRTITVTEEFYEQALKTYESLEKELRKEGITSFSQFIQWFFTKTKKYLKPLRHYNYYGDRITIWDEVNQRLVDVYNRDGILGCSFCESKNCEHIDFSYGLEEVQKAIKEGKIRKKQS